MRLHVAATLALAMLAPGCKKDEPSAEPGATQQSPATAGSAAEGNRRHGGEHEWDGGGHEGHERPK
jgi:hypothetical protein